MEREISETHARFKKKMHWFAPLMGGSSGGEEANIQSGVTAAASLGGGWSSVAVDTSLEWNALTEQSNAVYSITLPATAYRRGFLSLTTNGTHGNFMFGWATVTIPPGEVALVANPFATAYSLSIQSIFSYRDGANWFPSLAHGTVLAFYDRTNDLWQPFTVAAEYGEVAWQPHGMVEMRPGEGAVLSNPTTNTLDFTFCGGALTGEHYTNTIPAGWSVVSQINGESGSLESLGFPTDDNTIVRLWANGWTSFFATNTSKMQNWNLYSNGPPPVGMNKWTDNATNANAVPSLKPGEACFVYQATAKEWLQHGIAFPGDLPSALTNLNLAILSHTSSNLTLRAACLETNSNYTLQSTRTEFPGTTNAVTHFTNWVTEASWTATGSVHTLTVNLTNRPDLYLRVRKN
jgi:hypothetical protein